MKRRKWLWGIGIIATLVGVYMICIKIGEYRAEAAFQEQLRLARAEGIPTTAAEYSSLIKPAKPEENAAPFYRDAGRLMRLLYKDYPGPEIQSNLIWHPSPAAFAAADKSLNKYAAVLQDVDEAVKRPRCWFDRDWSQGVLVLLPEYADMKGCAKILLLRAWVEAAKGDSKAALSDANKTFIIAKHAGEEPHPIAHLVKEAIYSMAVDDIADWSFLYRNQPEYASALRTTIAEFPVPSLQQEDSDSLYSLLQLVNSTPEEIAKKTGLHEEDIQMTPQAKAVMKLASLGTTKADIVKGERAKWATLASPPDQREALLEEAEMNENQALMGYPVAAKVWEALTGTDWIERENSWNARKKIFEAEVRALSVHSIPKSIRTSDLLSPYDGKPLTYSFDGKQIVISIDTKNEGELEPQVLKIPPDEVKPAKK